MALDMVSVVLLCDLATGHSSLCEVCYGILPMISSAIGVVPDVMDVMYDGCDA